MSDEQKDMLKLADEALLGSSVARLTAFKASVLSDSLQSITSLSKQIEDACGRGYLATAKAAFEPLSSGAIWANLDKVKEPWKSLTDIASMQKISKISELIATPSKWSVDTISSATASIPSITESYLAASVSSLAALETHTSALAHDYGIPKITSIASQLSTITRLFSENTTSIKELIAPTTMLNDLQSLALNTHKTIADAGVVPNWELGVLDGASYLVDRQVDWASQLCRSACSVEPVTHLEELGIAAPKVNVISWLPIELEETKKRKKDITIEEALDESPVCRLSEKGKKLINKIVDINNLCIRLGRKQVFNYSGPSMIAAVTMGGTFCSTKESFGDILDCLYKIFYENIEHIKEYVGDQAIRNEEVFQCIFRVKMMRNDYRHDLNHGSESEIKKKEFDIGKSYAHYTGKPVITSRSEFQKAQEMLYDEFDKLIDYLQVKLEKTLS